MFVRVAVIDDEADIVDATKELLERWGCIVVVAKSGAVCWRPFAAEH